MMLITIIIIAAMCRCGVLIAFLIVPDILVQIFQVLGSTAPDLFQDSGDSAAALHFLPPRQSTGFRNMRPVFRGIDHVIDDLVEKNIQHPLRCVQLLRPCTTERVNNDPEVSHLLRAKDVKIVLAVDVFLERFENRRLAGRAD